MADRRPGAALRQARVIFLRQAASLDADGDYGLMAFERSGGDGVCRRRSRTPRMPHRSEDRCLNPFVRVPSLWSFLAGRTEALSNPAGALSDAELHEAALTMAQAGLDASSMHLMGTWAAPSVFPGRAGWKTRRLFSSVIHVSVTSGSRDRAAWPCSGRTDFDPDIVSSVGAVGISQSRLPRRPPSPRSSIWLS